MTTLMVLQIWVFACGRGPEVPMFARHNENPARGASARQTRR